MITLLVTGVALLVVALFQMPVLPEQQPVEKKPDYAAVGELCLLGYFAWMFYEAHKDNDSKQNRIDEMSRMADIEKQLSLSYQSEDYIIKALKITADLFGSDYAFFHILGGRSKPTSFEYVENGKAKLNVNSWGDLVFAGQFGGLTEPIMCGLDLGLPAWDEEDDQKDGVRKETPAERYGFDVPEGVRVYNMIVAPIYNKEDKLTCVLGVVNVPGRIYARRDVLKCIGQSFYRMYESRNAFRALQKLGEMDSLTGLYNRNGYQKRLDGYPGECAKSLACVYMDVNGLHELNNLRGHEAGDKMLQYVAQKIRMQFGEKDAYRIGGDEFVAFVPDGDRQDVEEKVLELKQAVKEGGYALSLGMSWGLADGLKLDSLIRQAECRMYEDKNRYYRQAGNDRRCRSRNVGA